MNDKLSILFIFKLLFYFVNCEKEIRIGFLTSFKYGAIGAIPLAINQIKYTFENDFFKIFRKV